MQNYALWWSGAGGVAFLAVLVSVIVLTGNRSPSKTHKQKLKKSRKRSCSRSRSPPKTTSHGLKRRTLNAFKRCQECRRKISVKDTHDLCLACLGRGHPMLNCRQCMVFTWKAFRGRFLRQFLWISGTRDDKTKDPGPPSARMSSKVLSDGIIELKGREQYLCLMADASQCYKQANSQSSAPLDISPSLSALEESPIS